VLNRLYIVIGVLAILALSAAFVVPRFIQWSDYRDRMEAIATEVFGTKVEIIGDIKFSLLPAPQLQFTNVVVGPSEEPVITVGSVAADFSLIDFLRDRYSITKLVLEQPRFDLKIDKAGHLQTGLKLPADLTTSNISVANARVEGGTVALADDRSDETFKTTGISGDVSFSSIHGPFAFQGTGVYGEQNYALRFNTSALDSAGATQLTVALKPASGSPAINVTGLLTIGAAPHFAGDLTYRQAARTAQAVDSAQGDLVFTSKLEVTPDRALLSAYTLQPDENRATNRLTGAASIQFGQQRAFNAVVSGGVFALPPRDATKDESAQPYEMVRLLNELPAPMIPPLPGTIGLDLSELDLRALSIRDLRLDATTDGKSWTIKQFSGSLPGNSTLTASGTLQAAAGKPSFTGQGSVTTKRLDALVALWRKVPGNSPLFGYPAALAGKVRLDAGTLALTDGSLTLDGIGHKVSTLVGFAGTRSLDVTADFGDLRPDDSAALAALMPDVTQDPGFGVTFPQGTLALSAVKGTVMGMDGQGLAAKGEWGPSGLHLSHLAAADLGGVSGDLSLSLAGTLADLQISGDGSVGVNSSGAPALALLYNAIGTPQPLRDTLAKSLPAQLHVRIDDPTPQHGQNVEATGKAGVADVELTANLGAGLVKALSGAISGKLSLTSDDPKGLTAQIGMGETSLMPEGTPMHVGLTVDGLLAGGFDTNVAIAGGTDSIGFHGNVGFADPAAPTGSGDVQMALSDASALADQLGVSGIYLPAVSGTAKFGFAGLQSLKLSAIVGQVGDDSFSGDLALARQGTSSDVSGSLSLGNIDVTALAASLGGPSALVSSGAGLWPDGPIAIGDHPRTTTGRVKIATQGISAAGSPLVSDAGFDFSWDATNVRLRGLQGTIGGGKISLDVGICCAGTLPQKEISGQVSLDNVALASLLPPAAAATLSGKASGGASFEATGDSFAAAIAALSGQGSVAVSDLNVEKFDPKAFTTVAGLDNVLDLDANDMTTLVAVALDKSPFTAPSVNAGFTIAGGTLRLANVAVDGAGAHLFGNASLKLADMGLDGSFAMTPAGAVDPKGLVNATDSKITAVLSGTLPNPVRTLDLASMVDAIKMHAYETEVARLEQLKAEDDARIKAAADDQARQDAAQKAADAKRKADADAAAKAAQDAAAKAARDNAATPPPANGAQPSPMDLGLPPNGQPFFRQLN
jgi:hypothetical protein